MKAAISRIIVLISFILLAQNASAVETNFSLEVQSPKKSLKMNHFYGLNLNNGECTYSFGESSSKKQTRKLKLEACVKFYKQFNSFFETSLAPFSDFYHPDIPMAEIYFKTGNIQWNRSISLESNRRCDKEGKCHKPEKNPLFPIVEKVISL